MARFYQTTGGNYLADKMLELPVELMSKVIANTDEGIDTALSGAVSLYDNLDANSLQEDTPRLREIVSGYEASVDSLVDQIKANPLEYQRRIGDVRRLGRQIRTDFTQGEVAAIESRFNQDVKWWEEAKALQKENPELYTDDYLRRLRADNISRSGAADYRGPGDYNTYQAGSLYGMPNLNDWVDNKLKDAVPDAESVEWDELSGNWLVKRKEGVETLTPSALNNILDGALKADLNLQNAIRQRATLGVGGFTGMVSPSGDILGSQIQEVEVVDENGNINKVPRIAFADNALGGAFMAGLEKYGFTKTENSITRQADPFALKQRDLENRIAFAKWEKQNKNELLGGGNYNQFTGTAMLTNPAGATREEYAQNIAFTQEKMQGIKDQVKEVVSLELGSSSLPVDVQAAIDSGNFTMLYDIEDEDGNPLFQSGVIKEMEQAYKGELFNMAIIDGVRKEWEGEVEEQWNKLRNDGNTGLTLSEYQKQQEPMFEVFLNDNRAIPVRQDFTWEGTGMKKKDITDYQNFLVDTGLYRSAPLELPPNTIVKDANGKNVDIGGLSLDQMIQRGVFLPEPKKIPKMVTVPGMTTSSGLQVSPDTYELQYELVDGSGVLGFDVSPDGIAPATSYDDDMRVELGMVVNFRGENVLAKIPTEITSTHLKNYETLTRGMYRTNFFLAKASKAGKVMIPGGGGSWIRNAKDGRQYIMEPTGINEDTGQPTYNSHDLSKPEYRKLLNDILHN